MTRIEWLRRYRERYHSRRPHLTAKQLDDLADVEAYDALSGEFPDDPEAAAERELRDWDAEEGPRERGR
jgi:hypothetical protein